MENFVLYVGIDVSSASWDVSFLDASARRARPPSVYPNEPAGWRALRQDVVIAAERQGPSARVVCGVESTSNMHKRVTEALRRASQQPVVVHEFNPRAVRHFAKVLLRDAKTDRLDSHLIAMFVLRMQPAARADMPDKFEELREATRTRRRLVEERTLAKNRLHKRLRYHLPGYRAILGIRLS